MEIFFLSDGKFFKKFRFQEIQSLFLASAEIGMHFQRQSSYFTHVKVAQFLLSDSTFVHATNYLLAWLFNPVCNVPMLNTHENFYVEN